MIDTLKRAIGVVKRIGHRPFDDLPLSGVGAEIGVWRGEHAAKLLRKFPSISMLYCVDPYREIDDSERIAENRLLRFKGRYRFIKGTVEDLGPHPLDFAYIDGNHNSPWPEIDIETVWPLIKSGGVMGGHDFHFHWPDVIRAVTNFAQQNNLKLNVAGPDWWFYKL